MEEEQICELMDITAELKREVWERKVLFEQKKDTDERSKKIWALTKQKFILESQSNESIKSYRGLISTVGFSPEPIILSILAVEPECVFFIYSKEAEYVLNTIIEETRLKPTQYKREGIIKSSASDAYHSVKKAMQFLTEQKGIKKELIALDPTGGTKIMSVGCGIAAAILNLNLIYMNYSKYNVNLRRPVPGTEQLVIIPNPFDIYQDDKILEGLNHLKSCNFARARDLFHEILDSSSTPLFSELLAHIADVLYCWDIIDYAQALNFLHRAVQIIQRIPHKINIIQDQLFMILDSWEKHLSSINNQIITGIREVEKISKVLIYDIKANAERDYYNGNLNTAALKYYRAIEMLNQFILFTEYNLDTQNPNYKTLPENVKERLLARNKGAGKNIEQVILHNYNAIWKDIYKTISPGQEIQARNMLPNKLGLFDGIILRYFLGDPFINTDFILEILHALENRNKSIFAHGISSVKKNLCGRLKEITETLVKSLDSDEHSTTKTFLLNKKTIDRLVELFIQVI